MLHYKVIFKMKAEIKARSAELRKQKRQGRTWKTIAEGQSIRHLFIAYARARGRDDEFIARADAGWQPDGTTTPPEGLRSGSRIGSLKRPVRRRLRRSLRRLRMSRDTFLQRLLAIVQEGSRDVPGAPEPYVSDAEVDEDCASAEYIVGGRRIGVFVGLDDPAMPPSLDSYTECWFKIEKDIPIDLTMHPIETFGEGLRWLMEDHDE